jgi:hypothetical protein
LRISYFQIADNEGQPLLNNSWNMNYELFGITQRLFEVLLQRVSVAKVTLSKLLLGGYSLSIN